MNKGRELRHEASVDVSVRTAHINFVSELESAVSNRLLNMLIASNTDLDWAMADMKGRIEILLQGAPEDGSLIDWVVSFKDLGVGGVRTADSVAEIADTISRQTDGLEGYMRSHGMISEEKETKLEALGVELEEKYSQIN